MTWEISGNPFRPAWWCPGAHAQTITARFIRTHDPKLPLERETLNTLDGDFLELDFLEGPPDAPWVVLLHGLEGSSRTPYMLSLLNSIYKAGWSACLVNFRGCSGKPNRLPTTYHSGKTSDLDFVLTSLLRRAGAREIYAAGFSIGGNILLKWLGERGETARPILRKAAAVSVPYDLIKSVDFMDQGFNREVYTRSLLASLKKKAFQKARLFPGCIDVKAVRRARTFSEFDRLVTAPLNGFRDEFHYWRDSSSGRYLRDIRVPTFLIHAADDPFFPGSKFPYHEIAGHPYVKVRMTDAGGHLGFLSGRWPWKQEPWLETAIMDFFKMCESEKIEAKGKK